MKLLKLVPDDTNIKFLKWRVPFFVVSLLLHLGIGNVRGPAIYLVRMLMMTSVAGAFGASITYISLRVPERRPSPRRKSSSALPSGPTVRWHA